MTILQRAGFDSAGRFPADLEMGTGAWAWGDTFMWGYGRGYGEGDVRGAFQGAIDAGVGFFDTAEVYGQGRSERLLGRFIAEGGARPFVATKFAPLPWRVGRRALIRALRGSLRRLGLERVDLYQIHWPLPLAPADAWADALADAFEAGLTASVGVSNYSGDQVRRMHAALERRGVPLATNQVDYSLLRRKIESDGTKDACDELGVRVIAYSPLSMGLLTGKYTPHAPPPGVRRWRQRHLLGRSQPVITLLREIGEARGRTPAQVALNWTICQGTIPIPGAKTRRQAEDNAGATGWRLSGDEVDALNEATQRAAL